MIMLIIKTIGIIAGCVGLFICGFRSGYNFGIQRYCTTMERVRKEVEMNPKTEAPTFNPLDHEQSK